MFPFPKILAQIFWNNDLKPAFLTNLISDSDSGGWESHLEKLRTSYALVIWHHSFDSAISELLGTLHVPVTGKDCCRWEAIGKGWGQDFMPEHLRRIIRERNTIVKCDIVRNERWCTFFYVLNIGLLYIWLWISLWIREVRNRKSYIIIDKCQVGS